MKNSKKMCMPRRIFECIPEKPQGVSAAQLERQKAQLEGQVIRRDMEKVKAVRDAAEKCGLIYNSGWPSLALSFLACVIASYPMARDFGLSCMLAKRVYGAIIGVVVAILTVRWLLNIYRAVKGKH